MSKEPKGHVTIKPIKLELYPQELDVVMSHLADGSFKMVNGLIQKIMAQANDPELQGVAPAPDSKSSESVPEPGGEKGSGEAKPDLSAALAVAAPILAAMATKQSTVEEPNG